MSDRKPFIILTNCFDNDAKQTLPSIKLINKSDRHWRQISSPLCFQPVMFDQYDWLRVGCYQSVARELDLKITLIMYAFTYNNMCGFTASFNRMYLIIFELSLNMYLCKYKYSVVKCISSRAIKNSYTNVCMYIHMYIKIDLQNAILAYSCSLHVNVKLFSHYVQF